MSCNKVVASDRAEKKMVKACEGGRKAHNFGAKGYGITILQLLKIFFELDINAVQLNQNLQLGIGLAKNFGQGQGVLQRVRQK